MKLFTSLLLVVMGFSLSAQITIKEQKVDVDGAENGYFVTIPYGDEKTIAKDLKEEMKSWKGKLSTKDVYFADDCKLKEIGDNTFDAYAKIEALTKGGVNVLVKIDLGGAFVNSKDHPTEYKVFEKKLYDFAVATAKNIIEEEAKEVEKIQKEKEDELKDIKEELEKQEDIIKDAKKQIANAEEAIKAGNQDKAKKETEIKETVSKVEMIREKKSAVK
ncbi:hypothetical protein DNU06_05090 [Putridiphycobacter roseus]|uniref:Uncharacterized protein n=1 Tax=Putridiphycobacter roseus TaxID=2219161 RepID=A0A2W1NJ62_9FLAO|nr:hypothetical protein [Putridiphycobacter roseus]PZE17996.1 hypothetical protein DNU06_05090 [Putridiphycobacter roseus]